MSDVISTLSVVVEGKKTSVDGMLQDLEADLAKANAGADRFGSNFGAKVGGGAEAAGAGLGRAAQQSLSLASTLARLDAAQGNAGGGAERLKAALEDAAGASAKQVAQTQIQILSLERLAEKEREAGQFGKQFTDSFVEGLTSFAAPAAAAEAAIEGIKGTVESFKQAFEFKAELDASRTSITAQIGSLRDMDQVWAEASAFADKYKLTQADTTAAIQGAIPIIRQSKASLEEILTTMQRLQVLKPEEGIKGAAFALGELQGGQVRSLETRFNVPAAKAEEMKKAIEGGADAIQVLSAYLDKAGIGAEALAASTKGAAGAIKDQARAEEELKLAQAQWAQGPGMAALNEQTTLTRGLTRLLGGGGGLREAFEGVAQAERQTYASGTAGAAVANALANTIERLTGTTQQNATATTQASAAQQQYQAIVDVLAGQLQAGAISSEQYTAAVATAAAGLRDSQVATQQSATAFGAYAAAAQAAQSSVDAFTAAQDKSAAALADELQKKQANKAQTDLLKAAEADLAALGAQVAGGLRTAGAAATIMASQYHIAYEEALKLVNAQAQLGRGGAAGAPAPLLEAGGREDRLTSASITEARAAAAKRAEDAHAALANQTIRTGTATEKAAQLQANYNEAVRRFGADSKQAIEAQTAILENEQKGAKGRQGAAEKAQKALLKGEQDYQNKSADQEQAYEDKITQIQESAAEKRKKAQEALDQQELDSRASFYERLAGITDHKQQQALAAKYEALQQETAKIASTMGADVAAAYEQAGEKAIESESSIEQKIAAAQEKAKNSKGSARQAALAEVEYQQGVLKLQQEADRKRLENIKNSGSQIENETQKQLRDAEQQYDKHLDTLDKSFTRKFGASPSGEKAAAGTRDTASGALPATTKDGKPATDTVQRVVDENAQQATDSLGARLEGKLDALTSAVRDLVGHIDSITTAVRGLKSSSVLGK